MFRLFSGSEKSEKIIFHLINLNMTQKTYLREGFEGKEAIKIYYLRYLSSRRLVRN